MGVRTLVGTADGTTPAAAMYDSASGWMIGPIFEGHDAPDRIEAFLEWLRSEGWKQEDGALFSGLPQVRHVTGFRDGRDPREWTDAALARLIARWSRDHVDEEGLVPAEASP